MFEYKVEGNGDFVLRVMEFVFKYRGVEHRLELPFESSTLAEVSQRLQELTATDISTQKLIGPNIKGALKLSDHPAQSLQQAGVVPGKRYTLIATSHTDLHNVQTLKEVPRIRGFEEEAVREAQRRRTAVSSFKPPDRAFSFGRYEVLQGALYPPPSTALQLLYRLANDVGIIGIMEKHRWKVGLLSEMPPEGKVGISQMCVLGYNVNKGQEIALRLRTDDRKGFRKYVTIRQTLIHELTHMVWSEHDDNFKQLNSQLLQECDQFLNQRGFLLDGAAALDEVEIATQQPDAGRRLGGEVMHKSAAAAAKDAALRRAGKFQKSHRDASRS